MNERLEKEIQGCQMVYRGLFHEHTNHCELIRRLFMEAYHFALEDVKKEVERQFIYWDGVMVSSASPNVVASKNRMEELLDFINELSK
jgi:hypothetical protein